MKIYKKMEAVVTDLSEVLDEVISFDVYARPVKAEKRKLAYAHYIDDEEESYRDFWDGDRKKSSINQNQNFTMVPLS